MQRLLTGIVGLCLAAGALVGLAPAAHASTPHDDTPYYSLTVADGSLHTAVGGGCKNFPYTYEAADADIVYWSIDAINPSGYVADSGFESQATGSDSFFLCSGTDPLGTYQVTGTLTQCYAYLDYDCFDTPVHDTFVITSDDPPPPPAPVVYTQAKVALNAFNKYPSYDGTVGFTIKAQKQTAAGYAPDSSVPVFLQYKYRGKWLTFKHSKGTTASNGVFKVKYRWTIRGSVALRAVLKPSGTYVGALSNPIKVTTRK